MFPNFLFQFSPFEEQQSPPEPEQSNGLSSGPSNSTQLILFRSPTPQVQPRPQLISEPTINSNRAPLVFVTRRQQPVGNSFFLPFASRQPAIPLEALLQFLQGGGNPPPPPADRAFVASLPVRRIAESDERKDCVVCQSQFEVNEECMELPCAHTFHPDCVRPWLSEHNTCPTCRHQLPAEPRREAADQSHVEQPQGEPQVAQRAENAPAEPVPRVDPVQETAITPANREITPAMMQSILRHRIALAEAALALDQEEIARAQAIIQHAEARMAFTRAFAESSRAQLAELMPSQQPQPQPAQPAIAMQPALQISQPQPQALQISQPQPQALQLQAQPQAAPSQSASIQSASQPPSAQAERTESDEVKSDRQSMETMQNELSALQTQVRKQERRIRALESALTAAKKVASRAAAGAAPQTSSSRTTTEEQMRNNLRAHFSGKPVRRRPASNLTVDTSVVASAGQTQNMEIDDAPDSDGRKKRKLEAGNEQVE